MVSDDQHWCECSLNQEKLAKFTFVFIVILQVCGEGHQIPAGPGTDERDGWAVCTLWTFLPLTHISQFHDETTEVESKMTPKIEA